MRRKFKTDPIRIVLGRALQRWGSKRLAFFPSRLHPPGYSHKVKQLGRFKPPSSQEGHAVRL